MHKGWTIPALAMRPLMIYCAYSKGKPKAQTPFSKLASRISPIPKGANMIKKSSFIYTHKVVPQLNCNIMKIYVGLEVVLHEF
jgi:hypothetical protein